MPITPLFAAIFAVFYVILSVAVVRHRFTKKISLGTGEDRALEKAARIHANFFEYVPFALLLLWFVEVVTTMQTLVMVLGSTLLVARILHAIGMNNMRQYAICRQVGVVLTLSVILICAAVLLWQYLPV